MRKNNQPDKEMWSEILRGFGIGVLLACLCFSILSSCSKGCPTRQTTEVVVQVDLTEAQLAQPDPDELTGLFGLDTNKWNGAVFSFGDLTDVSYNRRTTLTLAPGGNRLTSSSFTRDREVKKFEDSIQSFLTQRDADSIGRPHSSIYVPLSAELTRLAKSTSDKRVLIVYSDLMENSLDLSFYDKKIQNLLRTDPAKIMDQLTAKSELPDLTGITVYLIFQPKDAAQDELYRLVSSMYESLLTAHGATVKIAANVSADTH